jgi:hypothetical protein
VKTWQRRIEKGTLESPRGRKEQSREALLREVTRLRSQVQGLEHKLAQSDLIIELQKKSPTLPPSQTRAVA